MEGNQRYLSGFSQKSAIFGRTLILLAGMEIVATRIIARLRETSDEGRQKVNINKLVDEMDLYETELSGLSLIYHFKDSDAEITREEIGCLRAPSSSEEDLIGNGSGLRHFARDIRFKPDGTHESHINIRHELISKVLMHTLLERYQPESISRHSYGGWFELAYADFDTFAKVPYGVQLWARGKGIVSTGGPGYFGWYSNNNLIITRFQITEEIEGQRKLNLKQSIIPDLLRRDGIISPPSGSVLPYFVGHLIYDSDVDRWITYIDTDPTSDGMIFQVNRQGFDRIVPPGFMEHLLSLQPSSQEAGLFKT
ncbi:hypothetical protein GRI89_12015 [Altererythrobacter salegens]|uniref:Uncharacterized protein n=1 Tax=Croceibacterium salegens TaxID=1737568 RepID=A0A6I4SWQ2_9SPHN|nr:hypothetical protein [Croceibacterium salegens]MXO60263.1 hypothetical protein [Croceibacterium salegens]